MLGNPYHFEEHIGPGLSVLKLRDPADTPECEHGRLPLDRPKAGCDCWNGFLRVKRPEAPKPVGPPCECGCGERVSPGCRFVVRHNWRKRAA